ncbi:MAG: molybdate ABC transporter substrate-binding protein, partial [Oscillospiraceae bacterium]|nr:molybdate ABC transporter substrate-binding protein [Oscillospiraceae bacterium]
MKKLLSLILALLMVFALVSCGEKTSAPATPSPPVTASPTPDAPPEQTPVSSEPITLVVFAAASMKETLTEIAELYKSIAPNVALTFNFESSGTLLTQIQEGAEADIFISAAQKQMNTLRDSSGYLEDTRFNLVENTIALVVPAGNPANIRSYEDAINASSIALGNSDVPVGQYSQEIFTAMGAWTDEFLAKVTLGGNVKEVTSWVSEGVVDCGVVYSTDAVSAGLEIVA